jgi:flagellar basal-body rod modification protein FlgD
MRIESSGLNASEPAKLTDSAKASVDYDAFLKLLMEQLKSQDPTDPVDQTQTLAQLASFSNVEQTIKINEKLTRILETSGLNQSVQLIGRSVESMVDGRAGIVKTVEFSQSGPVALLESGERIEINAGIRVS